MPPSGSGAISLAIAFIAVQQLKRGAAWASAHSNGNEVAFLRAKALPLGYAFLLV